MTISVIDVPKDMSYVNAFRALWKQAKPSETFHNRTEQQWAEKSVDTASKVKQLFVTNIECDANNFYEKEDPFFIKDQGGRVINVSFKDFPKLDVSGYDGIYGSGMAQAALDEYNKISAKIRFDGNDTYRFADLTNTPLKAYAANSPRSLKKRSSATTPKSGCCIL